MLLRWICMKFSPIQKRILDLLADGLPHPRKDVWECLQDQLAPRTSVAPHIFFIRAKLRQLGQDIITETTGKAIFYRHVRFLNGHSPVGPDQSQLPPLPRRE